MIKISDGRAARYFDKFDTFPNCQSIQIDYFPDNTQLLKINTFDRQNKDITLTWLFDGNEEMISLLYIVKHLKSRGFEHIDLVMPYIPNARQDRIKTNEDVFTLKYFAEFINWLKFDNVIVFDPHSSVSEALINDITIVRPKGLIKQAISKISDPELLMFYPDEGAMKRYSEMINAPYAFGIKKRDWETGKILGLDVAGSTEMINGKNVLIVDDICSKGGTFLHSARKLKELGAKDIYLYVTHCENTIFEGELLTSGLIKRIFTTNSIFVGHDDNIEVMTIC